MLEQFQIPTEDEVRVPADTMRATVEDVFRALGMPDDHARQSADVLLYADIRGIDTHGVSNMLRVYVDWIRAGKISIPQMARAGIVLNLIGIVIVTVIALVVAPGALM